MAKFNKELAEKIVALIEEDNYTIVDICRILSFSRKMFYQWKNAYPGFALAVNEAVAVREEALKLKARQAMRKKLEGHKQIETKIVYTQPKDSDDPNELDVKEYVVKEKFRMPETSAIVHTLSGESACTKGQMQPQSTGAFMINVNKEKTKVDMEMLRKKMGK